MTSSSLKLCFQHQQKPSFSSGSKFNLITEFIEVQRTKFHIYITLQLSNSVLEAKIKDTDALRGSTTTEKELMFTFNE
jgi:hypothetical protein